MLFNKQFRSLRSLLQVGNMLVYHTHTHRLCVSALLQCGYALLQVCDDLILGCHCCFYSLFNHMRESASTRSSSLVKRSLTSSNAGPIRVVNCKSISPNLSILRCAVLTLARSGSPSFMRSNSCLMKLSSCGVSYARCESR